MSVASATLPEKLGKYEIRREVGRGGMGIVYEAFDPLISRRVALKTFIDEFFDGTQSDNLLTRLRREAQAAGRLNHPNIIAVYDYGEDANTAYIAMEFVEGRSLESCFAANARFPIKEVERIMSQLLDALQYSHDHGVVHRDIKPANMILLADDTVKVGDFGVARIESSTLTQFGTVLGSPNYMSPEQFMGQTVDGRSDLYSAGVVLYQLLTAEVPFTGAFTTIMHRVLNENAPPPSVLNVQVPRGFDAILTRAMAKRPDERYQSASEFKQAIVAAASGGAPTATGTLLRQRTDTPPTSGSKRPAVLSPAMLFSVLGVLLAAVVVGGYFLWHARSGGTIAAAPSATPAGTPPAAALPLAADDPATAGTSIISAVGVANPADPSYASDPGAAARTVWADARRQAVAKAAALYVQPASLDANYAIVQTKLLTHSDDFITTAVQQSPEMSKDGLMLGTLKATVNVREVQKSLNKISAEDRVQFIRNNGNPRISVTIREQTAGSDAGAASSELAENILKERIKSFGFTVVDDAMVKTPADFHVDGEVRFKRLSARSPALGLPLEKFVLTSWTVKAVDVKTGEEIYHNTAVPEKQSWATMELAMQEVGRLIGAQFTQTFFLEYFDFKPRKARLRFSGLPPLAANVVLTAVTGSLVVLNAAPVAQTGSDVVIDTELSGGSDSVTSTIQHAVLDPLNRRIGVPCFSLAAGDPAELHIVFDTTCNSAATINQLESAPPDALSGAPPGGPAVSPHAQKDVKVDDLPGKVTT